jgi:transposase
LNIKNEEKQKAQNLLMQGLKPKEVSSLLDVHISTIYNWKKELTSKPSNISEKTTPDNKSFSHSKNDIPPNEKTKNEETPKNENSIENEKIKKENQELKKEIDVLKTKIHELEGVITGLVLKLTKTNEDWLN